MNHSQSSENLFEPVPLNNGSQQGRNGQRPAPVIIVQLDRLARSFVAALVLSTLLSVYRHPVAGLIALIVTRGKRAIAGALMGMAIGCLIRRIYLWGLTVVVYSACESLCDPSTATSASCDSSTRKLCDRTKDQLNVAAGGDLFCQC